MDDTIMALSSGALPAAIAVLRLSGAQALPAACALAGDLPPAREARVRVLRDAAGEILDRAIVLVLPGPATVTGEDMVELHLHGGRAVVRAVEAALLAARGLRYADAGEFTRRALSHGRVGLTEVEGLGLLLAAESEAQRRSAQSMADGALHRSIMMLQRDTLGLAARIEALLDFSDEDDVGDDALHVAAIREDAADLAARIRQRLAAPTVDRLHAGFRVVLAGPPNAGKSSLLNALAQSDAAIVSDIAGTTRDRIAIPVTRGGYSYVLTDTAGIRAATDDPIETIGIARAHEAVADADLVLWLGDGEPSVGTALMLKLHPRADLAARAVPPRDRQAVTVHEPASVEALWQAIERAVAELVPAELESAMNQRQRSLLAKAAAAIEQSALEPDPVLIGEMLRSGLQAFDRITGAADTEAMLDSLFSRFCIGK